MKRKWLPFVTEIMAFSEDRCGARSIFPCAVCRCCPASQRERRETLLDHAKRRDHLSDWSPVMRLRDLLRQAAYHAGERAHPVVLRVVGWALDRMQSRMPSGGTANSFCDPTPVVTP